MTWLEPFPDEWLEDKTAVDPEAHYTDTESISLAFLTALQALPPRQRAVLLLRDVLDFSANETSEILEATPSSVNSALYRGRRTLSDHYHGHEPSALPPIEDERTQWLLDQFVQAWEKTDVDGLVALLREDAILAMPPSPSWYRGRTAIGQFAAATVFADGGMFGGLAAGRWRLVPARANASPAFAIYQQTDSKKYQAFGIHVLEIKDDKILQITSYIDPSLTERFGFPATLG